MRKIFTILAAVIFLVGGLGLAACGGRDAALVGTWEMVTFNPDLRYVFNADGTGDRGITDVFVDTFTWSISGDRLELSIDGVPADEIDVEEWTFDISGETLTLTSRQQAGIIEILERFSENGLDADVVGIWALAIMPDMGYTFYADGTGNITIDADVLDTFNWSTYGDFLHMRRHDPLPVENTNERWIFSRNGDVLTIQSRTFEGLNLDLIHR